MLKYTAQIYNINKTLQEPPKYCISGIYLLSHCLLIQYNYDISIGKFENVKNIEQSELKVIFTVRIYFKRPYFSYLILGFGALKYQLYSTKSIDVEQTYNPESGVIQDILKKSGFLEPPFLRLWQEVIWEVRWSRPHLWNTINNLLLLLL